MIFHADSESDGRLGLSLARLGAALDRRDDPQGGTQGPVTGEGGGPPQCYGPRILVICRYKG